LSTDFQDTPIDPTEWISQAEAARLRNVSRQAIAKLVRKGRLQTLEIGGHTLVRRGEIEQFVPLGAGRPKEDATSILEDIQLLLDQSTPEVRLHIFQRLRTEFTIHPIEQEFHASAELILEAIARSPDISKRGVRGLIAEAAFELNVVQQLPSGWTSLPVPNEASYDFLLQDIYGTVRIQVKTQRRKANDAQRIADTGITYRPMTAHEASRRLPGNMYVVETQRTRTGKTSTGEATRPYRYGEFDILAVSMYPSTTRWDVFMYTVASWLISREDNPSYLNTFQPVAMNPSTTWTDNIEESIKWFRSGNERKLLE
jgi:excisionase family DNA binding protein